MVVMHYAYMRKIIKYITKLKYLLLPKILIIRLTINQINR